MSRRTYSFIFIVMMGLHITGCVSAQEHPNMPDSALAGTSLEGQKIILTVNKLGSDYILTDIGFYEVSRDRDQPYRVLFACTYESMWGPSRHMIWKYEDVPQHNICGTWFSYEGLGWRGTMQNMYNTIIVRLNNIRREKRHQVLAAEKTDFARYVSEANRRFGKIAITFPMNSEIDFKRLIQEKADATLGDLAYMALMGGPGGAFAYLIFAPAEKIIKSNKKRNVAKSVERALKKTKLLEEFEKQLLRTVEERLENAVISLTSQQKAIIAKGTAVPDGYRTLIDKGIETVLEIEYLTTKLISTDRGTQFFMDARVRLINTTDNTVISQQDFWYIGNDIKMAKWTEKDIRAFRSQLQDANKDISEQIVSAILKQENVEK